MRCNQVPVLSTDDILEFVVNEYGHIFEPAHTVPQRVQNAVTVSRDFILKGQSNAICDGALRVLTTDSAIDLFKYIRYTLQPLEASLPLFIAFYIVLIDDMEIDLDLPYLGYLVDFYFEDYLESCGGWNGYVEGMELF